MCGRYSQAADLKTLTERFKASTRLPGLPARYNIAPSQDAPVVVRHAPAGRELVLMRWGLVPGWAKDPAAGPKMINARAETLAWKPSFRRPLERGRCLVLADGFYEWRKSPGGKVPMRFALRSGEPFAFAGLWDSWRGPEGKELRTFAIVTIAADGFMRPVHERMPVILAPGGEEPWLDPAPGDKAGARALLRPLPAGLMEAVEVSPLVNSPANEGPGLVLPADGHAAGPASRGGRGSRGAASGSPELPFAR